MYSLYMLKLSGCAAVSHLWRNTFLGNVWFHQIECNHLIWTSFCLCDLYDHFHHYHSIVNDFLLGCGDCCCWLNCKHLLLLGFWYFFSLILVCWCLNKLIEAFSPVFVLVDKYCPVALFCSIVFAKFLICWGGWSLRDWHLLLTAAQSLVVWCLDCSNWTERHLCEMLCAPQG